jgi:pilus assembly protein Flp/PilA
MSRGFFLGIRTDAYMVKLIHRFLSDESGATAIEYSLIASGIALAIIAVVNGIGPKLYQVHVDLDAT